ncbi:hypothetical protein [Stenomitos frigidus]|uniref:hypothetical protein n=1 Tax=Stenomitos frigidus TaxID=1886765 RepID=UPI0015E76804|nr:hypothetical protein [Stenomitos frigidus]
MDASTSGGSLGVAVSSQQSAVSTKTGWLSWNMMETNSIGFCLLLDSDQRTALKLIADR